jgi:hypothetical protein
VEHHVVSERSEVLTDPRVILEGEGEEESIEGMDGDTYAMHHLSAVFCLLFRNLRCQDIVDREQIPFVVGVVSSIDGDGRREGNEPEKWVLCLR